MLPGANFMGWCYCSWVIDYISWVNQLWARNGKEHHRHASLWDQAHKSRRGIWHCTAWASWSSIAGPTKRHLPCMLPTVGGLTANNTILLVNVIVHGSEKKSAEWACCSHTVTKYHSSCQRQNLTFKLITLFWIERAVYKSPFQTEEKFIPVLQPNI